MVVCDSKTQIRYHGQQTRRPAETTGTILKTSTRALAFTAAILSLSAVILAALGSHAVDMNGLLESWKAASRIHMFSAAALFGVAALHSRWESRLLIWGAWVVVTGTIMFSGGIYVHILTGFKVSNLVPAGGLVMMTGWLLAALAFLKKS